MERFFESLAESSLVTALLWLALKNQRIRLTIAPWARHLLWLLVCARFLSAFAPISSVRFELPSNPSTKLIASATKAPFHSVSQVEHRLLQPVIKAPKRVKTAATNVVKPKPLQVNEGIKQARTNPHLVGINAGARPPIAASKPPDSSFQISLFDLFTAIWLLGVIAISARMASGVLATRRLVSEAQSKPKSSWLGKNVALVCKTLRVRKIPSVRVSSTCATPFVTGLFRPTIILPCDIQSFGSPEQVRMIIAHEVAHIKRFDLFTGLVLHVARALLWFAPPVWLASSECSLSAEEACDAIATGRMSDHHARSFADALVRMASGPRQQRILIGAAHASPAFERLSRRIASIKAERSKGFVFNVLRLPLSILAMGLIVLMAPSYRFGLPALAEPLQKQIAELSGRPVFDFHALSDSPDDSSVALSIDDNRQNAWGYTSSGSAHPVHTEARWFSFGDWLAVFRPYHNSEIVASSNRGVVVNYYNNAQYQHASTDGDYFLKVPAKYPFSRGTAITKDGTQIAGYVYRNGPDSHAAVWDANHPDKNPDILPNLPDGHLSQAYGIENDGTTVGKSETESHTTHAVIWSHGSARDLGTLPQGRDSAAYAINSQGDVVGFSGESPPYGADGEQAHAALWRDQGTLIQELPGLNAVGNAKARALNDSGTVVGVSTGRGGMDPRATIWIGSKVYDLNKCSLGLPKGWVLRYATAVNNSDEIVGVAQANGKPHAFELTPQGAKGLTPL